MNASDFPRDSEPQAAAVARAAEEPVKALEYTLALVRRYARPIVAHCNRGLRDRAHTHRHASAARSPTSGMSRKVWPSCAASRSANPSENGS